MSTEDDLRKVSDQFYAALNRTLNGDAGSMREVWSHASEASTMHPIGGCQVGWDEVRASWEKVAKLASNGKVSLGGQRLWVGGDFAYELGTEHLHGWLAGHEVRADFRVTNIYRRECSDWRMTHHHADLDLKMVELLNKLDPSRQP